MQTITMYWRIFNQQILLNISLAYNKIIYLLNLPITNQPSIVLSEFNLNLIIMITIIHLTAFLIQVPIWSRHSFNLTQNLSQVIYYTYSNTNFNQIVTISLLKMIQTATDITNGFISQFEIWRKIQTTNSQ